MSARLRATPWWGKRRRPDVRAGVNEFVTSNAKAHPARWATSWHTYHALLDDFFERRPDLDPPPLRYGWSLYL